MYIIDGLFIIIMAICLQILISSILNIDPEQEMIKMTELSAQLEDPQVPLQQKPAILEEFLEVESEATRKMNGAYDLYKIFMRLVILLLLYFFKSLFEIIFSKLRGKVVEVFTVEKILNIVSSVIILYIILKWEIVHDRKESPVDPKYNKLAKMDSAMTDSIIKLVVGCGIILGAQWSRVFFILRLNRTFGPMIEIIITMLKKLVVFAVIFALIWIIFLFIGTVMFYDIEAFSDYISALKFLFSCALGEFDYSVFEVDDILTGKYYGYVYLTLYLIITNITLLNFLIAVLSDIYSILQQNSNTLYFRQVIRVKQYLDDDKHYS